MTHEVSLVKMVCNEYNIPDLVISGLRGLMYLLSDATLPHMSMFANIAVRGWG